MKRINKNALLTTLGLLISIISFSQTEFIDIIVNQEKINPDDGITLNELESFKININDKDKLFENTVQDVAVEFILANGKKTISIIEFSSYEDIELINLEKLLKNKGASGGRLILAFKSFSNSSGEVVITIPFII